MKTTALTVAVALAVGATTAVAGPTFEDYARVREVTPQYDQVNVPRKECYSEYVPGRASDRGGLSPARSLAASLAACSARVSDRAMDAWRRRQPAQWSVQSWETSWGTAIEVANTKSGRYVVAARWTTSRVVYPATAWPTSIRGAPTALCCLMTRAHGCRSG